MCFCQSLLSCLALAFCLDPETKLHKKHEVSPNLGNVNQPLQTNKKRGGICKKSRSEKQKQMNGALHSWTWRWIGSACVVGRKIGMALNCVFFGSSASIPEVWEREAHGEGRGEGRVEGKGISLLCFWWPCSFTRLSASLELFLLIHVPSFLYSEHLLNSWPCLAAMQGGVMLVCT